MFSRPPIPWLISAALLLGCSTRRADDEKPASVLASASASASAPAPGPPASLPSGVADVPSPAPEAPESARQARYARYAAELNDPDLVHCQEDYGLELNTGWRSDFSRRVLLAEVVRVEPELVQALLPGAESPLFWVLGKRNYGRPNDAPSDISAETFLVRCQDRSLCRAFAGLYQRVAQNGRPKGFCSKLSPHATSAEWPMPLAKLRAVPKAQPHATCGRYRACLAFENRAPAACDRAINAAVRCAELESCQEALHCFTSTTPAADAGEGVTRP